MHPWGADGVEAAVAVQLLLVQHVYAWLSLLSQLKALQHQQQQAGGRYTSAAVQ